MCEKYGAKKSELWEVGKNMGRLVKASAFVLCSKLIFPFTRCPRVLRTLSFHGMALRC